MDQIIAQAVGIVAMFFFVFSYQQKNAKGIILWQMIGTLLFTINFFMLGEYLGAILNFIGFVRAVLFLKKEKLHTGSIGWLIGFTALYLGAYALTFTVFGTEPTLPNFILQCCPVLGMFFQHLGLRNDDTKKIRMFCLVGSAAWLVYNCVVMAIGALLCETFNIISILVAMARFNRKKAE